MTAIVYWAISIFVLCMVLFRTEQVFRNPLTWIGVFAGACFILNLGDPRKPAPVVTKHVTQNITQNVTQRVTSGPAFQLSSTTIGVIVCVALVVCLVAFLNRRHRTRV